MSKKFLKIIVWLLGVAGIFMLMYISAFKTTDFRYLNEDKVLEYSFEDLQKATVVNTGVQFEEEKGVSEEDGAFFVVKLEHAFQIDGIDIELDDCSEERTSKIYYSIDSKEMVPDQWWEFGVKKGKTTVKVDSPSKIAYLRFDFTEKAGDYFVLSKVTVNVAKTVRTKFYVFTVLTEILFTIACAVYFGRGRIRDWVNSSEKRSAIYNECDQIISLALSDFKARFSGSYLGIVWGILQPLSTILLFWFVFQVGFRSGAITGYPFILWLSAGMIPWNYFYDSWFGGTGSFTNYGYIVKKVVFKIEYLPLVKVLSSTILNMIFNVILVCIYSIYGHFMGVHIIDMLYYSFCIFVLSLGLSFITATLNVFIKDVGQFMGIALQVLMWLTPMMWQYTMIPDRLSWIYKFNPLHYIINGYRESLIQGYFFYHQWKQMIYFWVVSLTILFFGMRLMHKLKDQFADVL